MASKCFVFSSIFSTFFHFGCHEKFGFNKGTLLIYAIIELEKIKNNILLINEEGKYIENKNTIKNYIIAEINIQKNNQNERIINSYEEADRNKKFIEYKKEYKNEKEIKDNCEIRINNKIIKFCYFYEFKEKGKYNIKYIFKNNIKNCNFMFYKCKKLTNINLSNFNANNVTNMEWMFSDCFYLRKKISK